ncbi:MAG: hypothetical protein HYY24_13680 [Verrucomicrobia bacterium]|nr:hypothetical protein [Verrucomicrobiota bacterium]
MILRLHDLHSRRGSPKNQLGLEADLASRAIHWNTEMKSDAPIDASLMDAATSCKQFRLGGGEWHFNLDTKATGMSPGIWQLIATLSDGSQHSVWIQIK